MVGQLLPVFASYLPQDELDSYIAGVVLLVAAPCTAMVFVWSRLVNGDPLFTLSQVALNDTPECGALRCPRLRRISASNFFELAVSTVVSLFGFQFGAAPAR